MFVKNLVYLLFVILNIAYGNNIDYGSDKCIKSSEIIFLDNNAKLCIVNVDDIDKPISIYMNFKNKRIYIDSYFVEGGNPLIEEVFSYEFESKENLIVLVS